MKRFWTSATVEAEGDGFTVKLDGRPIRTPGRVPLVVPTLALAEAMAEEWAACGETVDPRTMPLTGLANAAIDRIAPDAQAFAAGLGAYGESDLTCYRADGPSALAERQTESWDALQAWARQRYEVDFRCVSGVMHIAQPDETVARLGQAVAALGAFELAGLSPLVTVGGSLIAALAVYERAYPAGDAWEAVSLDDRWQLEQWGDDAEAVARLDARRAEFLAGARFLELLAA